MGYHLTWPYHMSLIVENIHVLYMYTCYINVIWFQSHSSGSRN